MKTFAKVQKIIHITKLNFKIMEKNIKKSYEDLNVKIELLIDEHLENVFWVKVSKPLIKSQLFNDINQAEIHFKHIVYQFL